MEYVTRLIEALAWPGVAVFIVWFFQGEIRSLARLAKKFKAGPLEAEFDREVIEVSRELAGTPARAGQAEESPQRQMLIDLARVNPRSAVIEAWIGVVAAARKAALQSAASLSPQPDVSTALKALGELTRGKRISPEDVALYQGLRGLRNRATHLDEFTLSESAALNYVNLASSLEGRLAKLAEL